MNYVMDLMDGSTLNAESKALIPWCLWNIWKNCNSILYAHKQDAQSRVIQRAKEEATLWEEVNKDTVFTSDPSSTTRLDDRSSRWFPPVHGTINAISIPIGEMLICIMELLVSQEITQVQCSFMLGKPSCAHIIG